MVDEKVKGRLIILGIIVGILIIALVIIYIKSHKNPDYPKEIIECISEKAVLYVQTGCHYCALQEQKFGKDKDLLNIVDCFYEREKCEGVTSTPSWEINGEIYNGVFSVEELKNMTGC